MSDTESEQEQEQEEQEQEERMKNIPEFKLGLLKKDVEQIQKAIQEVELLKEEKNKPKYQKEISKKINEEWNSILTLPELKDNTIDFNILKQLTQFRRSKL
jgi:superoxide dismutase